MEAVAGRDQAGAPRIRWRSQGSLLLLGVLAVYLLLSLVRSGLKPLWFDELGTMNVASQPTLAQMFRVEPGDGNPPFQYFPVRGSLHLLGRGALALRLPALLFVGLAIAGVYVFVGRRFGAAAGLLGATLLVFSPLGDYGVEARPYGLLLGLTMLLLLLWQRAAERKTRRSGVLFGLGVTAFALVIAQPLGIFWAGMPLLAAEVCRWWRTRRLDKGVLLALALGLTGFAITVHFGQATQRVLAAEAGNRHPAISLPSLHRLAEALRLLGLLPVVGLLAPVGLLAWWTRRQKEREGAIRSGAALHEWVAAGALAFTMVPAYLFTRFVTHYFWARYLMPGALGWLLLLAMTCGYVGRKGILLAVLGVGLALSFCDRLAIAKEKKPWPSGSPVSPLLSGAVDEPIVVGSPILYPQIRWYSTPALRARLHYVADAQHAAMTEDFVGDLTLIAMDRAGATLFPTDDLQGFLARNRRFLFWEGYLENGDWLQGYLRGEQYRFTPLGKDAAGQTLYQVEAPAAR